MPGSLSNQVHLTPCTLVGRRVALEPLSLAHLDALCEVGLDPEVWRLTRAKFHNREALRSYVEAALGEQARGSALPFVTRLGPGGRVVGSTRFGSIDMRNRRVEVGWTWIGKRWQRSFVNTEAKWLMLRQAFEEWGCVRVEFKADALNEVSRVALLRLGAQQECIFRHHFLADTGHLHDTVYFSILDDEWPAVKAGLEAKLNRT